MNEDDKRKLAEHLLNQLEQAETSLTGLEQRLSDEEDARLGRKLINLAGHFAVETGKVEGRSLFEAYEWSQEREKTDADARALFRAWSTSWSREEFAEKMGTIRTETTSGLVASRRLVEHYTDVLKAFEVSSPTAP
ncbi:hypothetical protein [Stutzerimonas nitrititolerans]|uniref:hypothetical protein n=1 Tax=Stutzerimonas nitrititolerans TaxID=2482751 RepID=UPI0028ABE457|nr:hypothetical protein [Stutzerimonas nitrititolerans]